MFTFIHIVQTFIAVAVLNFWFCCGAKTKRYTDLQFEEHSHIYSTARSGTDYSRTGQTPSKQEINSNTV